MDVVRNRSSSDSQFGNWADDYMQGRNRNHQDTHYSQDDEHYYSDAPVGPEPGDLDALAERLKHKWDPEGRVAALRESALRNGSAEALARQAQRPKTGDQAISILEKVFEDGAKELNMQPGEVATVRLIRGGMRDFIDYALDEVDRVGRMQKDIDGSGSFAWRSAGSAEDNPCLRRSLRQNTVVRSSKRLSKRSSRGLEYVPRPEPPEVTPASYLWPPPHLSLEKWGMDLKPFQEVPDGMSKEANRAARFSVV